MLLLRFLLLFLSLHFRFKHIDILKQADDPADKDQHQEYDAHSDQRVHRRFRHLFRDGIFRCKGHSGDLAHIVAYDQRKLHVPLFIGGCDPGNITVIAFFHRNCSAGDVRAQVILYVIPGFKRVLHHIILILFALDNILIQLLVRQAAEQGQILLRALLHGHHHRRIQLFIRIGSRRTSGNRSQADDHRENKPDFLYILFHISATSP